MCPNNHGIWWRSSVRFIKAKSKQTWKRNSTRKTRSKKSSCWGWITKDFADSCSKVNTCSWREFQWMQDFEFYKCLIHTPTPIHDANYYSFVVISIKDRSSKICNPFFLAIIGKSMDNENQMTIILQFRVNGLYYICVGCIRQTVAHWDFSK